VGKGGNLVLIIDFNVGCHASRHALLPVWCMTLRLYTFRLLNEAQQNPGGAKLI
jgi:hypothetical protein